MLSAYYGDFPVRHFTTVTDKDGKLYLLYLGSLMTGSMAAILTAFITVYFLGLLFRERPFRFGGFTGMVGVSLLVVIFVLNTDSFPSLFAKAPGFLIVDILNWMILIVFSGIASVLGHKTREKVLKFYKGSF